MYFVYSIWELVLFILIVSFIFCVCFLVAIKYYNRKLEQSEPPLVGTILIETTDPDGPYLFLGLDVPVDEVGQFEYVTCKIDTNGFVNTEDEDIL